MISHSRVALFLMIVFTWTTQVVGESSGPQSLFDGKSLEGWTGNANHWSVREGAITGRIEAGQSLEANQFLFWNGTVRDFELTLEFRITGDSSANSGIQFRCQRLNDGAAKGYQADLDSGAEWLGRIYDEEGRGLLVERGSSVSIAPDGRRWSDVWSSPEAFQSLLRPGEWNRYRILAVGTHAEVWINDQRVTSLDDHDVQESETEGRLAFQLHSGPGPAQIEFRQIQLRDMGTTAAVRSAALPADAANRQTQSPALWHLRPNRPNHAKQPATSPDATTDALAVEAQSVVDQMTLVDGFQAELIAAEPDIHQPIAMAFDARGRLWVVEAFSYPNRQPDGAGKDRLRILEDADGDGTFETKKTFMEGLNLVSGIELGFGGVWIGAAPQLLFVPDRDGDDRPDGPPQVLLDGFGYQDTHETLNSFAWGPDGWLYGNQGVFNTAAIGKPGASDNERVVLRAGVWRYHPVRHTFEVFAHGGSNQWGLDFSESGDLFMTHCRSYWGGGGTTFVIQNGHFWNQANAHYPPFISAMAPPSIPHLRNYLPASARYDSGEGGAGKPGTDAVYGGHSHVGTMIYGGDNWPSSYRNHLFTHNLHGHQLNHQFFQDDGSGYETFHAGYDLLHSSHPAYIPVDLQYGPDGAVYVIDWVDRQHCHNPRPEKWDRTNGRVYRISWKETYRPTQVNLDRLSDEQLVSLQEHANRWYAQTARRILQHRATERPIDAKLVDGLHQRLTSHGGRVALEALWALHAVQPESASELFERYVAYRADGPADKPVKRHADDRLRAFCVRLLSSGELSRLDAQADRLLELAKHDESPRVRLAIASALPRLNVKQWEIAEALAMHATDAHDRFLPGMVWYGLAPLVENQFPRALELAQRTPMPALADAIIWYASGYPQGRDLLLKSMAGDDDARAAHQLAILHFRLKDESRLTVPAGWKQVRERLASSKDPQVVAMLEELSAVFGDEQVLTLMRQRLTSPASTLANNRGTVDAVDERLAAFRLLQRAQDPATRLLYPQLLDDPALRPLVIPQLADTSSPEVAHRLLAGLDRYSDHEKAAALQVLTARREYADILLSSIEAGTLESKRLSALQVRQIHNLQDPQLTERLERLYGKVGVTSDDAKRLMEKLRQTYTTAPLWAYESQHGRQTFQKTCAVCHPLDGSSVPLGPSLKGSARNGLDYFLENVVDPNAVVGENYRMTTVTTHNGQVISGLVANETDESLSLRTAEKTVVVAKAEIDERRLSQDSLMPTGLLDQMSETEVIELLLFLLEE